MPDFGFPISLACAIPLVDITPPSLGQALPERLSWVVTSPLFIVFAVGAAEGFGRILGGVRCDLSFGDGLKINLGFVCKANHVKQNVRQLILDSCAQRKIRDLVPAFLSSRPLEQLQEFGGLD